jgi:hypothetical protein
MSILPFAAGIQTTSGSPTLYCRQASFDSCQRFRQQLKLQELVSSLFQDKSAGVWLAVFLMAS